MKNGKIVFIFDFDGTFYTGKDIFSLLPACIEKNRRKFLQNLNDKQYCKICKENPSWLLAVNGSEIVDHLYAFQETHPRYTISIDDFWNWQNQQPYPLNLDNATMVSPKFIKKICKKHPVYIVSNSSPTHVKHYMLQIKIKPKWFKEIISNHFEKFDRTKLHYYQDILNQEQCLPENVYVFGDNIKNDLTPAKKLKMNTFHIKNAEDIEKIIKNLQI